MACALFIFLNIGSLIIIVLAIRQRRALIECPECGRKNSRSASQCLGCGRQSRFERRHPLLNGVIGAAVFLALTFAAGIWAFRELAIQQRITQAEDAAKKKGELLAPAIPAAIVTPPPELTPQQKQAAAVEVTKGAAKKLAETDSQAEKTRLDRIAGPVTASLDSLKASNVKASIEGDRLNVFWLDVDEFTSARFLLLDERPTFLRIQRGTDAFAANERPAATHPLHRWHKLLAESFK